MKGNSVREQAVAWLQDHFSAGWDEFAQDAWIAGYTAALEQAWKVCQGPDEGYLHGCSCQGRVRAMLPEGDAWK